jgi:hypothetical protein
VVLSVPDGLLLLLLLTLQELLSVDVEDAGEDIDEDDADDRDSCERLMGEGECTGDGNGDSNGDSVRRKGCGEEEEEDDVSVSVPTFRLSAGGGRCCSSTFIGGTSGSSEGGEEDGGDTSGGGGTGGDDDDENDDEVDDDDDWKSRRARIWLKNPARLPGGRTLRLDRVRTTIPSPSPPPPPPPAAAGAVCFGWRAGVLGCLGRTGTQCTSSNSSQLKRKDRMCVCVCKCEPRATPSPPLGPVFPSHEGPTVSCAANDRMDLVVRCVCGEPCRPPYKRLALVSHLVVE